MLLGIILIFFEYAGQSAWIICWAVTTCFILIFQYIVPTWILPLFNKFTSLENGELRDSIFKYTESINFSLKNILCKKMVSGKFQLYVVDNIGNSVFIPVCNVSRYFTKKKVSRKWKRFEDELMSKYKHNNALHHALQSRSSKK